MPRYGRRRKKTRTHVQLSEIEYHSVPKNMVLKRGEIAAPVETLLREFREVFYPYTAMKVNDSESPKMNAIIKASKAYSMNNIILLSSTKKFNYVRFAKLAHGPTFVFRILRYSNKHDIQMSLPRSKKLSSKNLGSPLVILNGFGKGKKEDDSKLGYQERKVMKTMFNNLFPGLNLHKKPENVKRTVLIDYNKKLDIVEFRHYYVKQNHTGINKKLKKMVNNNRIPDLGNCNDLADYFKGAMGFVSDSDVDNLPNAKLDIETLKRDKIKKTKMKLRLFEIGPRITMQLVKIEEGLFGGPVFYHKFHNLTVEEEKKQKEVYKAKEQEKEKRRNQQEHNVKIKKKKASSLIEKLNKKIEKDYLKEVILGKRDKPEEGEEGEEEIKDEVVKKLKTQDEEEGEVEEEESGDETDKGFEGDEGEFEDYDYDKFEVDFV